MIKREEKGGSPLAFIQPIPRNYVSPPPYRKPRCDKKHRFTFRANKNIWDKIRQISLFAGGVGNSASLNLILNMLVQYALKDQEIIERIQRELPQMDDYIVIRDWKA